MSKQGKRKITVELPKAKDLSNRPSVFERLGTKKAAAAKKASESCRQWAQHGTCPYGKTCKFASTHTLISPSKQRAANKDSTEIKRTLIKDDAKSRLHSTVVVRSGRTPEPEWDNWDQNDLEYADADVLEKRRQQLQRELEIQLKMDTGKDNRKEKKKTVPSSSSSSRSSSTTSVSSSTSGGSSSSTSSPRDSRKKVRKAKSKRNSSSSSGSEHVSKKKRSKTDSLKRDKSASCKRTSLKKDVARVTKKHDVTAAKKKVTAKTALSKKSLSPSKKAGGTPPINNKNIPKGYILNKHNTHSKSPTKKDKNRSASPHSTKEREKDKEREREKERDRLKEKEREREKDRDKDREREREKERTTRRSKSPRSKGRSRSPLRRHGSHPPRDPRRKDSPTRSRGSSPKGRTARDNNSDKHRSKTSPARDERKDDKRKDKDLKDRPMEHRKDKHDEKDRHDRLRNRDHQREDTRMNREKEREEALARCQERQRERDRLKDQTKREQEAKRNRERDRRVIDKGLAKPTPDKPVERLLPRPEERLAALAATNNRNIGLERAISSNRDRSEARTERSSRKGDRSVDRDRIDRLPKRQNDRRNSMDRVDRNDYNRNMDRSYDHSHSMDRSYDRPNERYDDLVTLDRERERSPGSFPVQGRERDLHYDSPYDIQGSHSRGYVDPDERVYDDHLDDHLAVDRGFIDDGRARDCGRRDDHSWEGRETSVDQERQYIHHSHAQHGHPHKDWENDDYHGDWNRQDRHWQHRDPQHQVMDWTDKEREVDSTWHSHRQPAGGSNASRNRPHDDGNYRGRMDHGRMDQNQHLHSMSNKRNVGSRDVPPDMSDSKKPLNMSSQSGGPPHSNSSQPPHPSGETEDPIPDDLSEISDDPDEILNRDDEISEVTEPAVTASAPPDPQNSDPYGMIGLQPFRPDYEPMVEHDVEKPTPKQASVETSSQKSEISAGCQENNSAVPIVEHKAEQNQEPDPEDTLDNLGFEEISDGELEEDQRVKGLGDALGVDWASLVAEVQGKKEKGLGENGDSKEQNGARQYWQPQKVLARIGVSLYMAGETMVKEIFSEKKIVIKTEDGINSEVNGKEEEFKLSHPVASIQVAIERRKRQRLSLFGTGTGFTRALCARQDLALRRHLCNLPINESVHEIHPPDPQLFAMAQKLIQKSS